ncbi:MAG: RNA polymerase sigma factor [Ignavibacteriaceae bacterium]|nr:RNA polymerase sigma factor [Ignavibacteriaceae bacterium]
MKYGNLNYINFTQNELDELFVNSKNGDNKAFEALSGYVRHISFSYFQSKQRSGKIINIDDVDDLTNNVYLSFAEQYTKIDNLEFWLRRVMFLNFVNWYKKYKNSRLLELTEANFIENNEFNPGDSVDVQKILVNLDHLSQEKQKVIRMRFWEDLKFSEIAENLNKSEDAVKKMFYRTIEELKDMM